MSRIICKFEHHYYILLPLSFDYLACPHCAFSVECRGTRNAHYPSCTKFMEQTGWLEGSRYHCNVFWRRYNQMITKGTKIVSIK